MENSMSRVLVEMVVKKALKGMKDDPERGVRNLVDMALQLSAGRFQQRFFATAIKMLQNDLGYNGCTIGTRLILENEKKQEGR